MKNYLSLLLFSSVAIAANAAWDGTAQSWTQGDGSAASPYLIESEQQLAFLQSQVTSGVTYEDCYFRLVADLDMSADAGMKMLPIGYFDEYISEANPDAGLVDESKYFLGVFDGNFKTIDNLCVSFIGDESSVGGTGLFACINTGAVVKNLGLGSLSTVEGGELTGSLIGVMKGGELTCCYSEATVNSGASFGSGGLVGCADGGAIDRCYFGGTLNGNSDTGGMVGTAQYSVVVSNCYNRGNIVAPNGWYVGGICGSAYDNASFINCYNIGTVSGYAGFVASPQPIVGDADIAVTVNNCYFLEDAALSPSNGVMQKNETEMKSEEMVALLNGSQSSAPWETDVRNLNDGYPVLAWQNGNTAVPDVKSADAFRIIVRDRVIDICGLDIRTEVSIYNMQGSLVYSGYDKTVTVAARGIYIVKVGDTVSKVKL